MKKTSTTLFSLLCACSLAVLLCTLIYIFDNKYTVSGPQPAHGVLTLTEQDLLDHPVLMLVDQWAYYPGRLLTPDHFHTPAAAPVPDEYIYIGYYGGFEADNPDGSPHGSATYRLQIRLPDETQSYTLELPEIFSAYRVYVGGRLAAELGDPDPGYYRPQTLNRSITFTASGETDILIAVSDFSHLYSGMVYPPAFGNPAAVSQMLSLRFLFRALLSAAALTIGVLSIVVGILNRQRFTAVLYGLLCLFFVGYISYPLLKTFISSYYPFYALENFAFCGMLFIIALLGQRICRIRNRITLSFSVFGLFVCGSCLILHLTLSGGNIDILYGYSYLISIYEWLVAIYLTVLTLYTVFYKDTAARPLLIGITIFDTALVMDRLLPLHEPIITGWFPELCSFILIMLIGLTTAKAIVEQFRRNTVLEERAQNMTRLLEMQKTYYPLIQDKIQEAKTARHDLRHHLVTMSGLLAQNNYSGLKEYLANYQQLPADAAPITYCRNEVADILAHHYSRLAEHHGIALTLRLDIDNKISIADDDLCAMLSNLLENALESCLRQTDQAPFIKLTARTQAGVLAICMENTCGNASGRGSDFVSAKASGRTGYGLDSIRTIAAKYNGTADFQFAPEQAMFISQITLEI